MALKAGPALLKAARSVGATTVHRHKIPATTDLIYIRQLRLGSCFRHAAQNHLTGIFMDTEQ